MLKKGKSSNKENQKNIKKVPILTNPIFNYTEQIRIPTISSQQLKGLLRSVDLRKTNSNPFKKTVSRKSTCKSVKQNTNIQPPKIKTMMKQFKQLKLIHENERSKSKSPISCKSKSNKKFYFKKNQFKNYKSQMNSEANLTLKLQRTIKKLNQTDFFRQQQSIFPLKSSSDLESYRRKGQILVTENQEDINLMQLRQFCSKKQLRIKKNSGITFKSSDSFQQLMAALKIQRAWRRYQTKKLIQRYVYIQQHNSMNLIMTQMIESDIYQIMHNHRDQIEINKQNKQQQEYQQKIQILLPSQNLYQQQQDNNKIRQISNLQQQSNSNSNNIQQNYEQIVKNMKIQELNKWNQIIKLISNNKNKNPQELAVLLNQLALQSQQNIKSLSQKPLFINKNNNVIRNQRENQRENKTISSQQLIKHDRNKSGSSQSLGMQQYDSKKYIQYLDGDIYSNQQSNSQIKLQKTKISKLKQQQLLDQLKKNNYPIKLGDQALFHSQSLTHLEIYPQSQISTRHNLKKSSSQKILKRSLSQLSNYQNSDDDINIDLLTRQFLEGTDPMEQNLDMVYSQQKLKLKLAQLSQLKKQQEELQYNDQQQDKILIRSKHYQNLKNQIKIQQQQGPLLKVQIVQAQLSQDSQDIQQQNQKVQTISSIILNSLILQNLKDIAKSDNISQAFKKYSASLKPKIKKQQPGKKKKGFPTNKAQIQTFLQGLINYITKQQQKIFYNLQVSTGPSAIQMLRYMHQYGQQQDSQTQQDQDQSNVMVIPNRIFDVFWQMKQKLIVVEVPEGIDQANSVIFKHQFQLLKSFNKIFYRCLFDTFNQCLDCQRNFGQHGRPFPWKTAPVFDHKMPQQIIKTHISNARKKMIDISTTYCGLIIQKQQMINFSEQYVQQVHEDRLSRMLASDLIQAQQRWLFYDDEQTQILVQISNKIYDQILQEILVLFNI